MMLQTMHDAGETDIDVAHEVERAHHFRKEAKRRGFETEHRYDGKPAASVNKADEGWEPVDNANEPAVTKA